jgi:protein-S-isoprenylcysteine O-methyltransferase Ste14
MESPSPLLMILLFLLSGNKQLPYSLFFIFWLSHYLHRTFIYPFTQSGKNKNYPLIIVSMAFSFNCLNGFINGYGIFYLGDYYPGWLLSWQFVTGVILFISGFVINKKSDEKFRLLSKQNPGEYVIPEGWLFRYISNPHYFGEIIEWGGWALMTWSLPGFAFFIFTIANLFPRAISSHRWYRANFKDYPKERKAIIPFIV